MMRTRWSWSRREREASPQSDEAPPAGEGRGSDQAEEASLDPRVEAFDADGEVGPGKLIQWRTGEEPRSDAEGRRGLLARLREGLSKTRRALVGELEELLRGRKTVDAATLAELEDLLIGADLGVPATLRLIQELKERLGPKEVPDALQLTQTLRESIEGLLDQGSPDLTPAGGPILVIMVVGVNGVGKTTTIGKLAYAFRQEGRKVLVCAADTFRAAAVEQLEIWADRAGAEIVKGQRGADPSAVAYDAVQAAKARACDVLIADTAGRLHTKVNLMEELKKMKRVLGRELPGSPHEVLLVLDATTGQNALSQAKMFHQALDLTGLIMTKLDGTAKGGVLIGITHELGIPVKFIGIGEGMDDLRPFDRSAFAEALFAP